MLVAFYLFLLYFFAIHSPSLDHKCLRKKTPLQAFRPWCPSSTCVIQVPPKAAPNFCDRQCFKKIGSMKKRVRNVFCWGKRCDSCGSEVPDIQIYWMWDVDGCIVMAKDEGDSLKKWWKVFHLFRGMTWGMTCVMAKLKQFKFWQYFFEWRYFR